MKENFEYYTREEIDFKIKDLYEIVWPDLKQLLDQDVILSIESNFDDKINIKIRQAIIRFVFLLELVKVPKIETTKVRVRWFSQLNEDPRHCSFEECCQIFVSVYQQLSVWLLEERNKKLLIDQINNSLISYEIPLDYINRPESGNRIHTVDNIEWVRDEEYFAAISLRKYLLCNLEYEEDRKFFKDVLTKKIKVKTYLTDRVLTGDYKTNREKRWEKITTRGQKSDQSKGDVAPCHTPFQPAVPSRKATLRTSAAARISWGKPPPTASGSLRTSALPHSF